MNFDANFDRKWRTWLQAREEEDARLLLTGTILALPPGVRIHPIPSLTTATVGSEVLLREISLVPVGGDLSTVAGVPLVPRPRGFPRRRRVLLGGPPDYRVVGRFTP